MQKPGNYTVIDLEMTGLSAKTDKVLEIGAVRVREGQIVDTFATLVNPRIPIPDKVVELTGITDEMVSGGMETDDAIGKLLEFIGEDNIVGQNVMFDYSFLKQWAVNKGIPLELKAWDTLKIARKLLPKEQPKNLEALCSFFGIERKNAHRALEDTVETKELFEILMEQALASDEAGEKNEMIEDIFTPKILQYKAKRQTPATKRQMERLQEYRTKHGITEEINWETLTKSEASRIQDNYFSVYGR